jgi:hypothetical protein
LLKQLLSKCNPEEVRVLLKDTSLHNQKVLMDTDKLLESTPDPKYDLLKETLKEIKLFQQFHISLPNAIDDNNINVVKMMLQKYIINFNYVPLNEEYQYHKTLIDYCKQHGLAYWNWFNIMGGTGVINKWALKGLTSKDKLHLSRKGYEIQGALLHAAILKAYQEYQIIKSIKP